MCEKFLRGDASPGVSRGLLLGDASKAARVDYGYYVRERSGKEKDGLRIPDARLLFSLYTQTRDNEVFWDLLSAITIGFLL